MLLGGPLRPGMHDSEVAPSNSGWAMLSEINKHRISECGHALQTLLAGALAYM